MKVAWIFLVIALAVPGIVFADEKCKADTFTEQKSCVYGTETIGMAGVGNKISTQNGQMIYHKLIITTGNPLEVEALLFRLDDRRTIRLIAKNSSNPTVDCVSKYLCSWTWNVSAPISGAILAELAGAKKLIVAAESKEHRRTEESTMKKGGAIFLKFLNAIRASEPTVLETSAAEAYVQSGGQVMPYAKLTD